MMHWITDMKRRDWKLSFRSLFMLRTCRWEGFAADRIEMNEHTFHKTGGFDAL